MTKPTPKLKLPISKDEKRKRIIYDRIAIAIMFIVLIIMVITLKV